VATILVQTGIGVEELPRARAAHLEPDYVFDSLAQTADFLARWVRSE
jgi:ribonucleotide monophosphatase NagD (HAD superfamily)